MSTAETVHLFHGHGLSSGSGVCGGVSNGTHQIPVKMGPPYGGRELSVQAPAAPSQRAANRPSIFIASVLDALLQNTITEPQLSDRQLRRLSSETLEDTLFLSMIQNLFASLF